MKNKNNKINIILTCFGLLSVCGLANAQQAKKEINPDSSKKYSTISKSTFPQPIKVEDKKVEPIKVEDKSKIFINKSFSDRTQLVEKYGKHKGLIVGVFPESVLTVDTVSYLSRYLPFSNYLTISANELVSFAPTLNVKKLKETTAKGKYDLLYVNAEIAVIAVKNGYEPLVQRADKIVSVILTKKSSTISNVQDLSTAKVGAVPQAMVSTLARARFKKENVNVEFISGGLTGQKELILGLDNDVFNSIVVRKETAEELMIKDIDKYKIAVILEEAPGFILLAKKEIASSIKDGLSKGLLSLNVDNENDKLILKGLDGKTANFSKINIQEIENFENKIKLVN